MLSMFCWFGLDINIRSQIVFSEILAMNHYFPINLTIYGVTKKVWFYTNVQVEIHVVGAQKCFS